MNKKSEKLTILIASIIFALSIVILICLNENNFFAKKENFKAETNQNDGNGWYDDGNGWINGENDSNEDETSNDNKKQEEENIKAVNYCNTNLDKIYNKIDELKNNSFIKKYYPEKFVEIKKSNIDCSSTYSGYYLYEQHDFDNYYFFSVYTDEMDKEGPSLTFEFNLDKEKMIETSLMDGYDMEYLEPLNAANEIILKDYEKLENKYSDYDLGTFGDYDGSYDGGDIYIVRIAEYVDEYSGPQGKIICDYKVNFKTRTFERIDY